MRRSIFPVAGSMIEYFGAELIRHSPSSGSACQPCRKIIIIRSARSARRAGAAAIIHEEGIMAIRIERSDAVATIVIDRPEARNAVDGPAAGALADAFREFERDDALRAAVLWGAGGVFCAGADLKARGSGRRLRLSPDGDGPMGPSRMAFTKPVLAAVEGYAVAGGLELA